MLYAALAVLCVGLALAWFVAGLRRKRHHEDREVRRAERQRRRIIEWSVLEWLYGRRANLRITYQRAAERPSGNGAVDES